MAAAPCEGHCPARRRAEFFAAAARTPCRPLRTICLALSLFLAVSAAVGGGVAHHHAIRAREGTVLRVGALLRLRGAGNANCPDLFQAARDGDVARVRAPAGFQLQGWWLCGSLLLFVAMLPSPMPPPPHTC